MKLDTLPLYPDGPSTFALRGFDFFLPDTQNSVNDRTCARARTMNQTVLCFAMCTACAQAQPSPAS